MISQLPDRMYLDNLEQRLNRQIEEINDTLGGRITTLENPASASVNYSASPNTLQNSHPEWSTAAYTTAGITPATAGDSNQSCYNWKYQTVGATDLAASASLIASGHSGFGALNADAPVWGRVDGDFRLGGSTANYDISCQLPTDYVNPGQVFYVYFEASLAQADTDIQDAQFYCGFWDNTVGQQKWIEGSFAPTASVFGSAGSRTLKYRVHARTDSGTEMLSNELTVNFAPDSLSPNSHVRLNFAGQPGFIEFTIYRKDGSNYYRVGQVRNSIDLQFFDMSESGSTVVPVTGYPSVTSNTPKAYAQTADFEPSDAGTSFAAHTLTIVVPTSYNRSNTGAGKQFFRFGLSDLVASGSEREVIIRRISVSEGYGVWSRSPRDMQAASSPSSSATSGSGGGGGVIGDPPAGGGGGRTCVTLDTMIKTPDGEVPMGELKKGDWVSTGIHASRIKGFKRGTVAFVYEFETENGYVVKCSETHRFTISAKDHHGRPAAAFSIGDPIMTESGLSRVVRKDMVPGPVEVCTLVLPAPHLYISNGVVSHNNRKAEEGIVI